MFKIDEFEIRDLAADYGLDRPQYRQADCPELFECWADRVLDVHRKAHRNELTGGDIAEANSYAHR